MKKNMSRFPVPKFWGSIFQVDFLPCSWDGNSVEIWQPWIII